LSDNKTTGDKIRELRAKGLTYAVISTRLGVSFSMIYEHTAGLKRKKKKKKV
jgi:hypothetical protein